MAHEMPYGCYELLPIQIPGPVRGCLEGERQREFQNDEKIIWACIDLAVGDSVGFRSGDDSEWWLDSGNDH
jgi:hypothetical protein